MKTVAQKVLALESALPPSAVATPPGLAKLSAKPPAPPLAGPVFCTWKADACCGVRNGAAVSAAAASAATIRNVVFEFINSVKTTTLLIACLRQSFLY
jgi:hypothetical protein